VSYVDTVLETGLQRSRDVISTTAVSFSIASKGFPGRVIIFELAKEASTLSAFEATACRLRSNQGIYQRGKK
jgi:hypothetical protein